MVINKLFKKRCPNCDSKMFFINKRKMKTDKKYFIKVYLCKKCGNTYKEVIE